MLDVNKIMPLNIKGLAPGWSFAIAEVSAGHFVIEGQRTTGNQLRREGSDAVELAWEAGTDALLLNTQISDGERGDAGRYLVCSGVARRLPAGLKRILTEEILLGNTIAEDWSSWGQVVLLDHRFKVSRGGVEAPLLYRLVNDPHYWHEEVGFQGTDYCLAAGSTPPHRTKHGWTTGVSISIP